MQLYKYQRDMLNQIVTKFKTNNKLLAQLATSGGKTFLFSHLTKYWNDKYTKPDRRSRVLVMCHREELVNQAIEQMNKLGITCEAIWPKIKNPKHNCSCYVGMVQTITNRLKKNPLFFKNIDLVVVDECHVLIFDKLFGYFDKAKILGVTATPVIQKRLTFYKCKWCKTDSNVLDECCDQEMEEWTKPFAMSSIYQDVVIGPGIHELIDNYGSLVRDIAFVEDYAHTDDLKTDTDGEFTKESLDKAYSGTAFNVILNYEKLCKGKKTMVFNSSTKQNLLVYEKFKESGYNVRLYDSVNEELSGNRVELVKWFNDTNDAILCNVNCFVAGFNSKEVQAIILNTAIGSLSAYIQATGRGARITDKFFKDSFILIDGGGNIDRHQEFSDPTRDWESIFWNGIGRPKAKRQEAMDINACMECGALYLKSEPSCPECGAVIEPPEKKPAKEVELSDSVLAPIRKIPPPNAQAIYNFVKKKDENINYAYKVLINYCIDMFRFYRVSKETYIGTKANGNLIKTLKKMVHPCYFFLLKQKDIQTEGRRTLKYLISKTIEKLDKHYDI